MRGRGPCARLPLAGERPVPRAQHTRSEMSITLSEKVRGITAVVTGRSNSLFDPDLERLRPELLESVHGRRVLVAGGAGTIGAATVLKLLDYGPTEVTVVDPAENALAELVRAVRSRSYPFNGTLRVQPLGYGTPLADRFLSSLPPHDLVMSFAALKHVRSERDAFSTLRMFEVNVLEGAAFLNSSTSHGHGGRGVFFVSTDKAAHPASLMGASKRLMEMVLWGSTCTGPLTTARFANVAFSDGSLPWGFLQRLAKGEPLGAPRDVRRYLISPWEAADLCLLSCIAPTRSVVVPRLDPIDHTVTFPEIAEATLAAHGFQPRWCETEAEARARVTRDQAEGYYPVVLTTADTDGEKEMEEFVAQGERLRQSPFETLLTLHPTTVDAQDLTSVLSTFRRWTSANSDDLPSKSQISRLLATVIPDLGHRDTGVSLDNRI